MKIENDVQVTEPVAGSIIPTMRAGTAHVKMDGFIISARIRGKSWCIFMDFDEDGDLASYWEGAFDEHGNELHGGGTTRS